MSQSGDDEELQKLATTHDMYDRLSATLDQQDIDADVSRCVVLQLAGSHDFEVDFGEGISGDIHLAIVSDAGANLSRYLTRVSELAPGSVHHLNGTNTTKAGAIGSVSGGDLTPGPLLDSETDFTIIEQFDSLGSKTQESFQQILDTGRYSFAKANYRETVSTSGSVLLAQNPKYGDFDQYESISKQIDLSPSVLHSVDLAITNRQQESNQVDTDEDELPLELAQQYLELAQSYTPVLTDESRDEISDFLTEYKKVVAEKELEYYPGTGRLTDTLIRFTVAHARLRLAERTTESDAVRSRQLLKDILLSLGVDFETGRFDADVVDTAAHEDKEKREELDKLKRVISELESEYDEGAPIDLVLDRGVEIGLGDYSKIEELVTHLKHQGEAYEPQTDYLRVT
ncbi:minichromosome maintenance protein MCM [Halostella litorea]|uniref:minichromosome maintenance protein MCM n=1 Tax=Halostella litorea TaxID=2528831 RepID=UPI001386A2E1|nr:minichromosome maintenance protein MCM [Halostella litorea]